MGRLLIVSLFCLFFYSKEIASAFISEFCSFSNGELIFECPINQRNEFSNCFDLVSTTIDRISFQSCNISKLTSENFDEIEDHSVSEINVSGVGLTSLNDLIFIRFKELNKLIASKNQINKIFIFNNKLEYLDLSFNNFDNIDVIIAYDNKLETLILSNNKITKIRDNVFANFSQLTSLELSFNDLKEINGRPFDELMNLEHLNLANTNLSHISIESLANLTKLISLDLSENHIKAIDMKTSSAIFSNLQRFVMHTNGLNELNGFQSEKFPQLLDLDLRRNDLKCSDLKSILDSFGKGGDGDLPSEPILSENPEQAYQGLSCKPSPFDQGRISFQCTSYYSSYQNIHRIIVTCGKAFERQNDLGFYHEYYSNCEYYSDLESLTIGIQNCSMSNLPTEAFIQIGVTKIISLDVSNLNGDILNSSYFSELSDLQIMIAKHNNLKDFEENMFTNTKLNSLDLAYNQFSKIEIIGRSGVSGLKTLNISNNNIVEINVTSFKGLNRLEMLDLSFNKLTTIGDETFDALPNLITLSMANTHLVRIDFGLLSHLENLRSLDISQSTIRNVDIGFHSGIFKNLEKINMKSSEIMEIDGLTPTIFPNLSHIDLRSNRINCSHLKSILNSFDLNRLILQLDPSSKIKKNRSYRGIACEPDNEKINLTSGEQTENYKILPIKSPDDNSAVMNQALENHRMNKIMNTAFMIMMLIIFSLLGYTFFKIRNQLKNNSILIQVRRNPLKDNDLEIVYS